MNYRKILSMLLAIMMLLCSVSCGIIVVHDISDESQILPSNNNYGSDSSESVRDESNSSQNQYDKIDDGRTMSEEFLTEIGRHDFEDASITIFTTTDTYFRPSDDESVFSGLIRERQKKVQDMLGVTIKYEVVEQNSMLSRAVQAKAAGESECDIRMVPVYSLGGFGLKGVLADFNLLPSIDLSKPYFNESSIAASTFVSATYGVAGDAVLTPDIYTAVFMNKDLIKNAGLDPMRLYSLVNDGMWTWERMLVVGTTSKINYDIKSYLVTGSVTHRFPDIVFKSFGVIFKTGSS